jgi:hypothetical protein
MIAVYSMASFGSYDPGRHGAIYLTPSARNHPHTMRSETESLEVVGDSLAKAMRCNARVAYCFCLTGECRL